jgi:hypothetical protein
MKILEKLPGCARYEIPCFGPRDDYYTIFGSEIRFLFPLIISSLILGVLLFLYLNKKNRNNLYLNILISFLFTIFLFFSLAYFFPHSVNY